MGKEQQPNCLDWKRNLAIALWMATSAGAGAGVGITAFHGLLDQEPASRQESQVPRLVPTYTPTPKIEVSQIPEPTLKPLSPLIAEVKIGEKTLIFPEEKRRLFEARDFLIQLNPEELEKLNQRAEQVIDYLNQTKMSEPDFLLEKALKDDLSIMLPYQDRHIFEVYSKRIGVLPLDKENLVRVLAWYRLKYEFPIEQNPNYAQALEEMRFAVKVMNQIVEDKVPREWFFGGQSPKIPESLEGRICLATEMEVLPFFPRFML